ncbi:MAG TPA: HAMP domain-containing sensor histidine kinase [Gemmata sp.]|nr:HAMP domain-containing sensor histidine kinase [Gemmata sp.]
MSRRLLGPVGGPVVFFLVAALVFAGLGWVTYAALGVERAQREAAARADLNNELHRALSQLDVRMLSTLWGEDNRPYYDYAPPDPAATPLLVADLPAWMKLHFQLEPGRGWESPQVVDDAVIAERVRQAWLAWGDVQTPNLNGERLAARDALRDRFPPAVACGVFAARDQATASDPLPFAAPFIAGEANSTNWQAQGIKQPTPIPPAAQTPAVPAEPVSGGPAAPVYFFGVDLRWLADTRAAGQLAQNNPRNDAQKNLTEGPSQLGPDPRQANPQQANPQWGNSRGGRGGQADGERAFNDYVSRAQTIGKGIQEAKNAAGYQMGRGGFNQNSLDVRNYPNFGQGLGNSVLFPPAGDGNTSFGPPGIPMTQSPGGLPTIPGGPSQPGLPPGPGAGSPGGGQAGGTGMPGPPAAEPRDRVAREPERAADDRALGNLAHLAGNSLRAASEREDARKAAEELKRRLEADDAPNNAPRGPQLVPVVVPPVAVHLGSMRPQWITGRDGTQVLVLVRSVKFHDKTVYQGIVIDWAELQAELKSVIEDVFPAAALVPVSDAGGASAARAMTTLPVQLDPGPQPEPPPAGWTPLRIGLVLAWVAAVVAVVAVGFSGWSLIDLAERRIRFVSAVTHELRTPLTSLRLYLDLLVSGMIRDEAQRQEYLSTLAVESDRLHRLIDNVLDFARLEKRKKNGDVKPVNVGELTEQLRTTWADRVARDGKELVVVSTLPGEREVTTDAGMVLQIVGNLIDNARKYARDAADPRIWVWARPSEGRAVLLEVEDRGPGVPAGERKTIFKPFRRGEHADSTSGGAGLGLALARSWAEVLGARLTYRPADGGVGACFRLELPGG